MAEHRWAEWLVVILVSLVVLYVLAQLFGPALALQ